MKLPLITYVALGLFVAPCQSQAAFGHRHATREASAKSLIIVPGYRIGELALKSYPSGLPLGKPRASDAGMSHYHELWTSVHREGRRAVTETVFAAAVSNGPVTGGPGVTLQAIRVTSPEFMTADGVGAGVTLRTTRRRFPHLIPADGHPAVLVDARNGIAFEFAGHIPATSSSRCIAVSIFKPNDVQIFDASDIADLLKQTAQP